ncbi:MAG: META domain-containing protein [Arenimonas sp.]|nr:META domain-containing protein [Arenimonas sp.]
MKKILALLFLLVLTACDGEFKMSDVVGNWQLISIDSQPAPKEVRGNQGVTLDIQEDGKFAGQAPVNRYFGQIKVNGKIIKIGPVGSTMMAGPPELMQAEQDYFKALGEQIKSAKVESGKLVITAMDDKKLVFDRAK